MDRERIEAIKIIGGLSNMIYYTSERTEKNDNATEKAPRDIEKVCSRLGYSAISFPKSKRDGKIEKIRNAVKCEMAWIKAMREISSGDILLYQYPMSCMPVSIRQVEKLRRKGIKIIAFIHDINSVRFATGGYSRKKLDFYTKCDYSLNQFDVVICHNTEMKKLLLNRKMVEESKKIISLDVFDYICNDNGRGTQISDRRSVVIAGNLSKVKSAFIYKSTEISFNLYGLNYEGGSDDPDRKYYGSFNADELPEKINGDFGLVWDGDSVDTCTGNHGEYLKYNNPHKLSLYLASNLPVFVWKKAACARFVEENGVGLSIESLMEIPDIFSKLSVSDYERLQSNARRIGSQIRAGFHTEKAIKEAMRILSE